jgi:hypothetical protein
MLDDAEKKTTQFAFCLCSNGNLLSQWRGYGASGGGYAIGFVTKHLSQFGAKPRVPDLGYSPSAAVFVRRVIYDSNQQKALVRRWLAALARQTRAVRAASGSGILDFARDTSAQTINLLLYQCLVSFKHPGFQEEEEWRIIQQGRIGDVDICAEGFRSRAGRIVHYAALSHQNDRNRTHELPIATITFGPTLDPQATARALDLLVKNHASGRKISIVPSGIPFIT